MTDTVHLIDTTLRDGHQSLWASRLRFGAMMPAIADIGHAGYDGVEFIGRTAHFTRAVRDLHENPFDWTREGAAATDANVLRLHGGIQKRFGSREAPLSVRRAFLGRIAEAGIRTTRCTDSWNNYDRLRRDVEVVGDAGIKAVANIIYSVSPRHTDEYFERCVRDALEIGAYRLCLKDVGGLLTPERTAVLVPKLLAIAGDVPLELHAHCTNGLGPYVVLVAVDAGIRYVHTAIPPLANGNSMPSVFDVHDNLVERGYHVDLDIEALRRVSDHLELVRQLEGHPAGEQHPYLESYYSHQMPGGMVSNLRFQLGQLGHTDRFEEILEEAAQVRADFGYPIMVTPLSQFVGTQAVLNVIVGERYKQVSDETIQYALGCYGEEAPRFADPDVLDRILGRSRAREVEASLVGSDEDADVDFETVRTWFPAGTSDDEVMARVLAGVPTGPLDFADPSEAPRTYEAYRRTHQPVLELAERFNGDGRIGSMHLRFGSGDRISMSKPVG